MTAKIRICKDFPCCEEKHWKKIVAALEAEYGHVKLKECMGECDGGVSVQVGKRVLKIKKPQQAVEKVAARLEK